MSSRTEREYRTPPEVAAHLGIDAGKVLAWIRAGELRAFNLAEPGASKARWRIRDSDLEEFLTRRANKPPPPKPRRRKRDPGYREYI